MAPCTRSSLWVHLAALKRWQLLFLLICAAVESSTALPLPAQSTNCSTSGAVRLVDGLNATEGRVQLCLNSVWGGVCASLWGATDARVVCRQLGFATNGALAHANTMLGHGSSTTHIGSVRCYGHEHNLIDCPYLYTDNCNLLAGVTCSGNCDEGAVRLSGGSTPAHGRVEICIGQVWGTVCDDLWGKKDARVVCRQLGYSTIGSLAVNNVLFGPGSGPIHLDDVQCFGFENSLLHCDHITMDVNCNHDEDAAVACQEQCFLPGKLRLVAGSSKTEGRVEICLGGVWGTVCDDSWSDSNAQVVCRQLGYVTEGAVAHSHAHFQQGYGPIQLDNVECSGNETSLLSCAHNMTHNCVHSEDAGVTCQGVCVDGEVRLAGASVSEQGRVEVCTGGVWGTVCDQFWGPLDARVVCRQLGFQHKGAVAHLNAYFGQGTGPIALNRVQCLGNESSLTDCLHTIINSCGHSDDAGVSCIAPEPCTSEGHLRLAGGSVSTEGRVEICLGGVWGTVCNDRWSDQNAQVVCRQLNYTPIDATSFSYAYSLFGSGTGPVQLSVVECAGDEESLINCSHTSSHYCGHTKDVGVRCHESCSTNGALRLVGGTNATEGRVEICQGVWGTVCDSQWGPSDAEVVCRQLGYAAEGALAHNNAYFGEGSGPIFIGRTQCSGSESSIAQCTYNTVTQCSHSDDAGVTCSGYCADGDVRLREDGDHTRGQVEVCHDHTWSPVCVTHWTAVEAQVVCRQLGLLSTGAVAYSDTQVSSYNRTLYSIECSVSDNSLAQCKRTISSSCGDNGFAGVRCTELCNAEGKLRLVRGSNQTEGFVEVCHDGIWAGVCDDEWDSSDAEVACRQLGYVSDDAVAYSSSLLDHGAGLVHLSNLQCVGNESHLQNCVGTLADMCSGEAGVSCSGICYEGELRLTGGSSPTEGRVEVCIEGMWGTVCDSSWAAKDAEVACRQAGYLSVDAIAHSVPMFGGALGGVHLTEVQCIGDESELVDCHHKQTHNCSLQLNAGVICEEACGDDGSVRLVGETGSVGGRVEICLGGVWGTICDDYWDQLDAQVVCRQLGLPTNGAVAVPNAYFGQGSGPIQLDDVECTGKETSITNCSSTTVVNCMHSEDAGVRCPVPPSHPRACNAVTLNSTSITLRWLPPFVPNGMIIRYIIKYRPQLSLAGLNYSLSPNLTATTAGRTRQLRLTNLLTASYYSFTIYAVNVFGMSSAFSGFCASYTQEAAPTGPPRSVSARADRNGGILVTWEPPALKLRNGQIVHYYIKYSSALNISEQHNIVVGAVLSYQIPDTQFGALYNISVAACTSAGFGPYGNISIFIEQESLTTPTISSSGRQMITLHIQPLTTIQISHYQIAVVKLPTDSLPTQSPDHLFPDHNSFLNYTEANRITSRPVAYIAAEFAASLFPLNRQYIIGKDSQPNDRKRLYTNALLEVGKTYTCFLRAYPVNTNESVRQYSSFISSGYSAPVYTGIIEIVLPVATGVGGLILVVLLMVGCLVCSVTVCIKKKGKHHDTSMYSESDVRINPMYLDMLEADDKKQLTTKNRPNDNGFVREKEEEEEPADENAQMNTSISNDSEMLIGL